MCVIFSDLATKSSQLVILLISVLVFIYSIGRKPLNIVWWLLGTASALVVVSTRHWLVLLTAWGILGAVLYFALVPFSSEAAKKTLIIIGGADVFLLVGALWVVLKAGSYDITMAKGAPVGWFPVVLIVLGAMAKVAAFPLNTWLPPAVEAASGEVAALFPSTLDKVAGIYLIYRVLDIFDYIYRPLPVLVGLGAFTAIAGVMMALIQHRTRRLLGYHAISQVGYMLIGLGCGNPAGIVGGFLHMINNVVYKTGLFLVSSSAERVTGTQDMEVPSGLARSMPLTYFSALVMSLAISGIPPLNGFVSKWLIYQGFVKLVKDSSGFHAIFWLICFAMALMGSALTLASFLKFVYALFFGPQRDIKKGENFLQAFSLMAFSLLCIFMGLAGFPVLSRVLGESWFASIPTLPLSTLMLFLFATGALAALVYIGGRIRQVEPYIGGERLKEQNVVSPATFYRHIMDVAPLNHIYRAASRGFFDIYYLLKEGVFSVSRVLSFLHTGILHTYTAWFLLGMVIVGLILLGVGHG